jgi:hypothetical protein
MEAAMNAKPIELLSAALNNACGEISEAARLAPEIFSGDELKHIRRELARLMEQIDSRILVVLKTRDLTGQNR